MSADLAALRERIEAVKALTYAVDDGTSWEHNEDCDGESDCAGCWADSIRRALGVCVVCGSEVSRENGYIRHARLGVVVCWTCPKTDVCREDITTHAVYTVVPHSAGVSGE